MVLTMTFFEEFKQKLNVLYDIDNLTSIVKHPVYKVFHFKHTSTLDELVSFICPLNHRKLHQIHSVNSFTAYACFGEFKPYNFNFRIVLAPKFIRISLGTTLIITINESTTKENLEVSYNSEHYPISSLIDETLYEIMYQDELEDIDFRYPEIKSFAEFHVKNNKSIDDIKISTIKNNDIIYYSLEKFEEMLQTYSFEKKIGGFFDLNVSDFNSLFFNFTNRNVIDNINTIHSLLFFESYLDGNNLDKTIRSCMCNDIPFKFYSDYYFYTIPMPSNSTLGFKQCLALGTHDDVLSYHTLTDNSPFYADNEFENSIFGYLNIYEHIRERIKQKIMKTLDIEEELINLNSIELYSMMKC